MAGETGVSGKSGNSRSSSSSSWVGGAPSAAAGGAFLLVGPGRVQEWQVWVIRLNSSSSSCALLRKGLGLTKCPECRRPEMTGGGLSGRGAAAGVVGGEVEKVLTITLVAVPSVPDVPSILKLDTVTDWPGVWGRGPPLSLVEKSRRHEIASRSTSSWFPSSSRRRLSDLKKGETEWGRTVPLPPVDEEEEDPELYPSSRGGAVGITGLATTKKKITHYNPHFQEK